MRLASRSREGERDKRVCVRPAPRKGVSRDAVVSQSKTAAPRLRGARGDDGGCRSPRCVADSAVVDESVLGGTQTPQGTTVAPLYISPARRSNTKEEQKR